MQAQDQPNRGRCEVKEKPEGEGEQLSSVEFMAGMYNAPHDKDACTECGGNGLRPIFCCVGHGCGCRGMPINFIKCECGRTPITNEEIKKIINLSKEPLEVGCRSC